MKKSESRVVNGSEDRKSAPGLMKNTIIDKLNSCYVKLKLLEDYSRRLGEDHGVGPAEAFGIAEMAKDLTEHQRIMSEHLDGWSIEFVEKPKFKARKFKEPEASSEAVKSPD